MCWISHPNLKIHMKMVNKQRRISGLFAPRVSQQYRDEQRRRRSQFDRGTTAAEREIVYVRTIAPKHSSIDHDVLRTAPCTYPSGKLWYEDDATIRARGPRTS